MLHTKMTPMELGKVYLVEMPYSEVCMHMQIAGNLHFIGLVGNPRHPMVQVYNLDMKPFSAPITQGEAGVFDHFNEDTRESFLYCNTVDVRENDVPAVVAVVPQPMTTDTEAKLREYAKYVAEFPLSDPRD